MPKLPRYYKMYLVFGLYSCGWGPWKNCLIGKGMHMTNWGFYNVYPRYYDIYLVLGWFTWLGFTKQLSNKKRNVYD
jgi:hypothetical protein